MDKEREDQRGYDSRGPGKISVVGIGPGGLDQLTGKAVEALKDADAVAGYTRYVNLIKELIKGKEVFTSGMTEEVLRCEGAVSLALSGKKVAVVSSGDSGIYGMAGLVMQIAAKEKAKVEIEVIPGVPAFVSAAAILGAPLMHDFASISLSDLLTPWHKIEERLEATAGSDFVIVLYNPKSSKRVHGLSKALDIITRHRHELTPVGIVRNASRDGEHAVITPLGSVAAHLDKIDMLTVLIIGNSSTMIIGNGMVTPRGYRGV